MAIATLGIMYCIASSIVLNFKIIKERIAVVRKQIFSTMILTKLGDT